MPRINIHRVYMNIAREIAQLSYAERKKVGAILVKDKNIIAMGYNGMPKGFDNVCEEEEMREHMHKGSGAFMGTGRKVTKKEVLHAESNAIAKCARSVNSSEGSTLYVTCSPCIECSKLIIQAGISEVYYEESYRDMSGAELLKEANIKILQL